MLSFLQVVTYGLLILFRARVQATDSFAHVINKEPNDHLAALAQISDSPTGLERTFLSHAHRKAAKQLKMWMEEAGMEAWVDAIGNVHGRVSGMDAGAAATVIGSHYDTVLDGGKYDGSLGIVVGIAAIKYIVLQAAEQAGAEIGELAPGAPVPEGARAAAQNVLRAPIHLVGFTDEEGVRFKSTFLGSRALVGSLVSRGMLHAQDRQGQTLKQVLEAEHAALNGQDSKHAEDLLSTLAFPPNSVKEYVEVHIEQGPVLENMGVALGSVSAIAGQTRLWVVVNGTQGHAGTVPMRGRADALAAGAHIVSTIEQTCGGGPAAAPSSIDGKALDDDMLVCTVGELHVWPGASNVIPRSIQLSVDIRAKADKLRTSTVQRIKEDINGICAARGVSCSVAQNHDAPAILSDAELVQDLVDAIRSSQPLLQSLLANVESAPGGKQRHTADGGQCVWSEADKGVKLEACTEPSLEVPVLVSGAGHDAMAMAEITKVAMMFVRCKGGISHSPLEFTQPEDVAAASAALAMFLAGRTL